MALRSIRMKLDAFLYKKCRKVEQIDERIRMLLDDMAETMYATPNGGGLAACQVGILKRLVVIDVGSGLYKLVNPEIVESDGERVVTEGCLSFPDIWAKVKRPRHVVVKALDEQGNPLTIDTEDEMLTKCLCHEIDHLDGIVFLDKAIELVTP